MTKAPPPIDAALCEELADRASRADDRAWKELVAHLWPFLQRLLRADRSMGSRARSEDEVGEVLTRLLEKLGASNGRGLRLYFSWKERHLDKTFEDWLRIVAKNAVRDHLRAELGPRSPSGEPSVKRLLNEFASSPALEKLGVRPPITAAQTARELLEFARDHLPSDQLEALHAWLMGDTFGEIGASQNEGESAEEVGRRLVRSAVATLRRRFSG